MSNPFANWTMAQAQAHNARVAQRGRDMEHAQRLKPDPTDQQPTREMIERRSQDFAIGIRPSTDEAKLNKTERDFLAHIRNVIKPGWLSIQGMTLKLADDCRLTPDFAYTDEGFVFVDVKGFQREDALIKMKMAARMYSWARFVIVKRDKTKPFGWSFEEVKP